jgi:hypothetical protein
MSGTTLMMQPLPPQVPEFVYAAIIQSLGAEELSTEGRIEKLLSLSDTELATLAPPSLPLLPIVDYELIPGNINFAQISSKEGPSVSMPGRHWCEELLIGDCQFDVSFSVSSPGLYLADHLSPGFNLQIHARPPNSRCCKNLL